MKDEELLNLYWNRNEDAISETAKRYGGYLTKIAGNILSDFNSYCFNFNTMSKSNRPYYFITRAQNRNRIFSRQINFVQFRQ